MVKVKAEYVNCMKVTKLDTFDYFVYTNVEVEGHADHTGYTNNMKLCAGISACCHGITRLLNELDYHVEIRSGYFHVWTGSTLLKELDKESVYALNTLVCQLYELYRDYPKAFKSFELVDVKEQYDGKTKQSNKAKRWRKRKYMGIYPTNEEEHN